MPKQPPNINGVMDLTPTEENAVINKLIAIRNAFVETDEQPTCDTFYLVSTYNKQNTGKEINGDTAEAIFN